ncbi:hypothetical protein JOC86_000176 [Bacillus pakistanensis]|uniref:Uncharacterized protein n=1 Tax=Rossellomorea pakistanensis TaxID=992288 RepID=A0ABS2N793_9BACI|nr:hypothetical protein [Bacillus pakistanensis]MBM7583639.1 hypothetical protein [Bacillus pakistanensis]
MKKYLTFIILFGFFFTLAHKIALMSLIMFFKEDPFMLVNYYSDFGLLSIKNLILSTLGGTVAFFFALRFMKWENSKREK